jgi:dipeptide/tripeptide permease
MFGRQKNINVTQIEQLGPWTTNIFLQVPQYVVLTLAECLFSITGLAFAYSQVISKGFHIYVFVNERYRL